MKTVSFKIRTHVTISIPYDSNDYTMNAFLSFSLSLSLSLYIYIYIYIYICVCVCCPVGWGCRIHWLLLCRLVRPPPPQRVSWIWHKTIWWRGFINAGSLGNAEYLFVAIDLRSTLAQSGSTWLGPIIGSNRTVWHLNCVLMLNWIV